MYSAGAFRDSVQAVDNRVDAGEYDLKMRRRHLSMNENGYSLGEGSLSHIFLSRLSYPFIVRKPNKK